MNSKDKERLSIAINRLMTSFDPKIEPSEVSVEYIPIKDKNGNWLNGMYSENTNQIRKIIRQTLHFRDRLFNGNILLY